jgi:tetratricopeptide (TPR) repeat protein
MTATGSAQIWPAAAPFVGWRPFRRSDADRYFGQEAEVQAVRLALLSSRIVVIHGPSASGKTSLLRAGVLPALAADPELDVLPAAELKLTAARPLTQLVRNAAAYAVLQSWARPLPGSSAATISDYLLSRPSLPGDARAGDSLVAAIDQFDDVFTIPGEERRAFIEELAVALHQVPTLKLLILLRDENLERFELSQRWLGTPEIAFSSLNGLSPEGAVRAITQPLAGIGRGVAADAVEDLVIRLSALSAGGPGGWPRAATGPVAPLLLQLVCTELWSRWPASESTVTADRLSELADFSAAFSHFYDDVVDEVHLATGQPENTLRAWLEDVFIADDRELKEVRRGSLVTADMANAVADAFAERHLLAPEQRPAGLWYRLSYPSFAGPLRQVNRQWRAAGEHGTSTSQFDVAPPDTFAAAAEAAMGEGNLVSAQRYAKKAAERYRSTGDERRLAHTLMLRGDIARADGDIDSAKENFNAALNRFTALEDRNLTARTLSALADIQILTGDYPSAVVLQELAVQQLPTDTDALIGLGYAQWYSGYPADADATFSQAITWDPGAARAYVGRGQVRAEMREYAAALADVGRALTAELPPEYEGDALSAKALALAGLGQHEEAETALAGALASDPSRTRTHFRSARIAVLQNQPSAAIHDLRRALSGWPPLSPPEEITARRMLLRLRGSGG